MDVLCWHCLYNLLGFIPFALAGASLLAQLCACGRLRAFSCFSLGPSPSSPASRNLRTPSHRRAFPWRRPASKPTHAKENKR